MARFLHRRLFAIMRLAVLFVSCSFFWHWYFPYSASPKYTLATGLEQHPHGKFGSIIYVDHVANDGKSVRLTDMSVAGFMRSFDSIKWDVLNNYRVEAPAEDPDWQELQNLAGDNFKTHDRAFWEPFLQRWQERRRQSEQADGRNKVAQDTDERSALFPMGSSLSADGLFFAYGYDVPLEEIPKGKGYDVIVEEVSTGRRIATIPDEQYISIAAGGRIAAKLDWRRQQQDRADEFTIWDLATGQPILHEKMPRASEARFLFSRNGRFIFLACDRGGFDDPDTVTWWDGKGRRIGTAMHACNLLLLDSDRTLATFSNGSFAFTPGPPRPRLVQFWDVQSGALLGTWVAQRGDAWFIGGLSCASRDERYVAVSAAHHPETSTFDPKALLQLRSPVARRIDSDESQERTIILDSRTQRALIDVPGRSAEFSANGRWLATIDDESVIRIWELPLRKPWRPILWVTAVATLALEAMFRLLRRLIRHTRQS